MGDFVITKKEEKVEEEAEEQVKKYEEQIGIKEEPEEEKSICDDFRKTMGVSEEKILENKKTGTDIILCPECYVKRTSEKKEADNKSKSKKKLSKKWKAILTTLTTIAIIVICLLFGRLLGLLLI